MSLPAAEGLMSFHQALDVDTTLPEGQGGTQPGRVAQATATQVTPSGLRATRRQWAAPRMDILEEVPTATARVLSPWLLLLGLLVGLL